MIKEKKMTVTNKLISTSLCVFLFFSYISPYMILFLGVSVILAFIEILLGGKKYAWGTDILVVVCAGLGILGFSFRARDVVESLIFGIVILGFTIITCYMKKQSDVCKQKIMNLILGVTFIHVVATILQCHCSSIIMSINQKILNESSYRVVWYLFNSGKYAGISPQTGTNAFFIMVFLSISINRVFESKNFWRISCVLIGFYALFLTGKRAPLLILGLMCLIGIYCYVYSKLRRRDKAFLIWLSATFAFLILVCGVVVMDSLLAGIDLDELSSGRTSIYEFMIAEAIKSPVLGNGFGYVESEIGIQGHNIYLQLLCEYGLFACVIICWLCIWLKTSVRITFCEPGGLNRTVFFMQLYFLLYGVFGNPLYDYFQLGIYMLFYSLHNFEKRTQLTVHQ